MNFWKDDEKYFLHEQEQQVMLIQNRSAICKTLIKKKNMPLVSTNFQVLCIKFSVVQ